MKVIVCNGGKRTGSTLSYMIALKLLERAKIPFEARGSSPDEIDSLIKSPLRWFVIKCHTWLPKNNLDHVPVIHTVRDPLQVAASLLHVNPQVPLETVLETLRQNRIRQSMMRRKGLIISYSDLYHNLPLAIARISVLIKIKPSDLICGKIANQLGISKIATKCEAMKQADSYTQLRPNHLSPHLGNPEGWRAVLSEEWIERITDEMWMRGV